jgi:hypothetical protein
VQEDEDPQRFQDKIANHRMLVLKNNQIPKGLIPLERLFDQDDIPLKSTLQPRPKEVEDCDIGTKGNPNWSKYLNTFHLKRKINTLSYSNSTKMSSLGLMMN